MRKTWVIASREYQAAVRSKAFLISLLAMPIMFGGSIIAQLVLHDKVDTTEKRIAIVDRTGVIYDTIADAARQRNEHEIFRGAGPAARQVKPRFVLERVDPPAGRDAVTSLTLSDRVRAREIFAFVDIGPDVLDPDPSNDRASVAYHSNSPTYDDFRNWLAVVLNAKIQQIRLDRAGLDRGIVARAMRTAPIENLALSSVDAAGNVVEGEKINELANLFVPMGLMMLMFVAILVGSSPLVQTVLEEKMARIAEVLLGSVSPFQLMLGKLIGMVGVSLTIVAVYLAGGYAALRYAGYASYFPTRLLLWFLLFQSLAVLMYGSLYSAIGAAVTDMKEAQSVLMPVVLLVMAPMFVWINVAREPSSTLSVAMSLFPPATPMLMILRQGVPPGVPLWQPLVGVVLVLATTIVCIFAAGRIFRVGLLMQGKGANFRQMLQWIWRG